MNFKKESFLKKKNTKNHESGGPSKDELYLYLYYYLKKYKPYALETTISQIASKHGHLVLYSCCFLNFTWSVFT